MRQVGGGLRTGGKARLAHAEGVLPVRELRIAPVGLGWHVAHEHFDDHFLRMQRARAGARHLHPRAGTTATGRCKHALPLDLDHARAAVSVRAHAGLVAEPGNRYAEAIGGLDDRLACERVHLSAVELEDDALLLERARQGCVHAAPLNPPAPAENT
jgi:hypothetical protein